MDYDALRSASFTLLDDAVSDWSLLVDHLERLERDAGVGLRGAANRANWAGVNATVSREFIGKTAGEFKDAHAQAKSVHRILSDTRDELKRHHRRLEEAVERGLEKNLTVTATGGGGFTVSMNVHPDRAGKGNSVPEHGERDVAALRDEVQRILDEATESDSTGAMCSGRSPIRAGTGSLRSRTRIGTARSRRWRRRTSCRSWPGRIRGT
ncbi:hypothetical protein GCM10018785_47780 [Streptomyces longispororuber]|uniref:Uncharacterized protein n=1 Tax=Streptomyces longispororuber TaxID=68230 RepID=A0A919DRA1_9ACTN|nr:hypothetical protein [Streptomyces longispororuber]GHE74052.1 hypothetical protein GCM10018785_47780 [Streptomyces longispororuber]